MQIQYKSYKEIRMKKKMNIIVISVGKIKESFYRDAIKEYEKRLSRYCTFEIIEVADEKTPDQISDLQMEQIKEKEGKRILGKVKEQSYVIALSILGQKRTSIQLAKHLETLAIQGQSHITFIIGGSLGLCDEVLLRANEELSFSDMTFPHQLMRVILVEQIYRSFRIQKNEPYHK